jgi:prepilin-type processing-associated H-X9-DG protein
MLGGNDTSNGGDWKAFYVQDSMVKLPPATRILFFDTWGLKEGTHDARWSGFWALPSVGNAYQTTQLGMTFPHAGASNALWYDAHASTADADKVGTYTTEVRDNFWARSMTQLHFPYTWY